MKITIITVCFNSAKTLAKTIESVCNQTYKDYEYIIIDGGSNDGTIDIIRKYDNVVSKWVTEPDNGLYDAMNKGISMATGDIVGILNSDDFFFDESVLQQLAKFHEMNDVDASVGDVVQHNSKGKIIRKYSAKSWFPEKLKNAFMPPHPAVFIKKDLFSKYGNYSTDFIIAADWELITRYFLNKQISWKYSGIITTSMLIGGVSSSGLNSYMISTREIKKALMMNHISFSNVRIELRCLWKLWEYFKR